MCSIIAVIHSNPRSQSATVEVHDTFYLLRHRGQDATGIVSCSAGDCPYMCLRWSTKVVHSHLHLACSERGFCSTSAVATITILSEILDYKLHSPNETIYNRKSRHHTPPTPASPIPPPKASTPPSHSSPSSPTRSHHSSLQPTSSPSTLPFPPSSHSPH
jgi:hypothetical protein